MSLHTTDPSLHYVDSDGNGIPDGFVSVRTSTVGRPDDGGRVVLRVVETRVSGIGDDGVPTRVHIHERMTEGRDDGTERELATYDVDLEPDDPATAVAVLEAIGEAPLDEASP